MSNTGYNNIAELPQGWKVEISSKILDIRDGTHDTPNYVQDGIPLVTSKNLKGKDIDFNNTNKISLEDHLAISKRSKVVEGDILFAMIGTIGNPILIRGNTNFSIKNVALFKKNESEIVPEFLFYYLGSRVFDQQLIDKKFLKGTTQKFIPLGSFRSLELPVPPLNEQHQIVEKIEELFSELDKGIENLKTAQQQLKVYRQAVLKWAFEGNYDTIKIGELFDFIGGGTPSKKEYSFWNGNIPWASVKDVKGDYLERTEDMITGAGLKNSSTNIANPDDVILITRISPGKVIISNIRAAINQDLKIVRPKFKTSKKYIFYLFKSIERECINLSSGTTVLGINLINLRDIRIPAIDFNEQQEIVEKIESRLSGCDKMEESITNSLQQAEALRQSILKKAFEGKLVREFKN